MPRKPAPNRPPMRRRGKPAKTPEPERELSLAEAPFPKGPRLDRLVHTAAVALTLCLQQLACEVIC
jgi:hypothetical protein